MVPLVDVMTTPYNHVAGKRVLDDRKPPAEQPQTPVSDSGPPDPTEARMRRALGLQAESQAGNQRQLPEQDKPVLGAAGSSLEQMSSNRRRRRFVNDGEVPVVLVHGRRNLAEDAGASLSARVEIAENAAAAERAARVEAERVLEETRVLVRDLQTKLGHAGLALNEAGEAARASAAEAEALRTTIGQLEERLLAEESAKVAAEQALRATEAALAAERIARRDAARTAAGSREKAEKRSAKKTATRPVARRAKPATKTPLRSPRKKAKTATSKQEPEPQPVKWWIKSRPRRRQKSAGG